MAGLTDKPVWRYRANWKNDVVETLEWKTRSLKSVTGAEQRAALRATPRRYYEFTITLANGERAAYDREIMRVGRGEWYLPLYPDRIPAIAPVAATDSTIFTRSQPDPTDFLVGGVLILQEPDSRPAAYRIAEVVDGGVRIEGQFGRAWPSTTSVYPARSAVLRDFPSFDRYTDSAIEGSAAFRINESNPRPFMLTQSKDAGPMILDGLIANSYHQETGRGGYFHTNSGTSEGQSVMIYAMFRAYDFLKTGSFEERQTADYYRSLAYEMLDALGDGSATGPMLRQPIPTNVNTITMLHWLFAARGDIPMRGIVYAQISRNNGGYLAIETNARGSDVYTVWKVYPATSKLLYDSPYSPAYHVNPDGSLGPVDTSFVIADEPGPNSWYHEGLRTIVKLPPGADLGISQWKIVYGYENAGLIPYKYAQEAYPSWTLIPSGYVACAPDTFRWFDQALNAAMEFDDRPGKATGWTMLRNAMRRSAVRGQAINDLRVVIEPLPGFDPIPAKGAPDGMYCYSDHPAALPPANGTLSRQWKGYDFWGRLGDGDIWGGIPGGARGPNPTQSQIGRGFSDSWRVATSYQDADHFLYVALGTTRAADLGTREGVYAYVSATRSYDETTRWYVELTSLPGFVPGVNNIVDYWIPISAFRTRRYNNDGSITWGDTFPPGQAFENFGISVEMRTNVEVRLRYMRIVGGPSAEWVLANKALAVQGSKMPFFPGALPFATNGDIPKQRYVGWNGNPFHGYQLADFWWFLGADADAVHPTLTVNDLPIPDPAGGGLTYPIAPLNPNGTTKPKNALLMEQQLLFLKHAQDKYRADSLAAGRSTPIGPFAHTFVLNTPARVSIGNPTPHTWVYTNDDPNTRWIGYQTRLVESMAVLVYLTKDAPTFEQPRAMALDMLVKWLQFLDWAWPNLDGKVYGGVRVYGSPTQYPSPFDAAPYADYEEPHGVALVLRGCLWLKKAVSTYNTLCNALLSRSWAYMEMMWRTEGEMAYTWSPNPEGKQWYGFWHAEIIEALVLMLENPSLLPSDIDLAVVRSRLVQTSRFLKDWGVRRTNAVTVDYLPDQYQGYSVFTLPPDERDRLNISYSRFEDQVDNQTAIPYILDIGERGYTSQAYSFFVHTKAEHNYLVDMFYSIRGQALPFWLPTFMNDINIVQDVAEDDQTILVETGTYGDEDNNPVPGRRDIYIELRNGTKLFRRIVTLTADVGGVIFRLNEPIRDAFTVDEVRRVSFMELSRLAQDSVDISHRSDAIDGVSVVTVTFTSAPDDRLPLPAFYA